MTAHKPSQADEAHIATAEHRREQRAAQDRMGKLREARLAQAKAELPKSKPKRKSAAHRKTAGFSRWS